MRVMLLGAGGMLGQDVIAAAPPSVSLSAFGHASLDITNADTLRVRIAELRPEIIINTAAYTAVDRAETEQELAWKVNAEAVGGLGTIAHEYGVHVVHFSTDYVFDGKSRTPYKEEDSPNPLNIYGASKLEGERRLLSSGVSHILIRTQWLFGPRGRSFPRTMWERARDRIVARVVNDQVGRPTYTPDLAHATWRLIAVKAAGTVHVTNSGQATWYELARRVYEAAAAGDLVRPCSSAEAPRPARRPEWSVLDSSRYELITAHRLPSWEDGVNRFLDAICV